MNMGAEAGAPSPVARDEHLDQQQKRNVITASTESVWKNVPNVNVKSKPGELLAKTQQEWNTKNLGSRLAADGASAAAAGALVAPIITMIDKCVNRTIVLVLVLLHVSTNRTQSHHRERLRKAILCPLLQSQLHRPPPATPPLPPLQALPPNLRPLHRDLPDRQPARHKFQHPALT